MLGVLFGLAQLLMVSITPICLLLSLWMIILGLLQKYWALRVAFDADLFALMAKDIERTGELDQSLQTLGLQPANRASRPWTERQRGALKLLRKQAYLLAAQVLLTLAVILASPWLPFAG